MADGSREGDAEDTDELLCTDLDEDSVLGLPPPLLKRDHCDLLLDAIDAQLSRLQVQSHNHVTGSTGKRDCISTELNRSQSVSRDTGLGSTIPTNDTFMSCADFVPFELKDQSTGRRTDVRTNPVAPDDTESRMREGMRGEGEDRREQCRWRLARLLGRACEGGGGGGGGGGPDGGPSPPQDSVRTEDFASRFREEMVVGLDDDGGAERRSVTDGGPNRTEKPPRGAKGGEKREESADGAARPPRRQREVSVPGPPSSSSSTGILTQARSTLEPEGNRERKSRASRTRHLAGVPVCSFDSVTIDSDLDSVRTENVRQHIRPRCLSVIQSVRNMDGLCTDQSDYDTASQEPRGPMQHTPVFRARHGNMTGVTPPLRKPRHSRRDTPRYVRSVGEDEDEDDDDEDTDGCVLRRRRRRLDRTMGRGPMTPRAAVEELRSDWVKTEEDLATLAQDCEEEEEERLRLKRAQRCEIERSLSDLLQERKHALQELEQLRAEAGLMKREGRSLEACLRDSRAEAESTSCQLRRLQRQRDCCVQEVRDLEEELAALSQRRAALQDDGHLVEERQGLSGVSVSVLEREEMDRQLDAAKTELFAEQRRSRIKLDSLQEQLDEAREELQRVMEEDRCLRDRCASLEETQQRKLEQLEEVEQRVSDQQRALAEREGRLGALEKIVAQKELQLSGLQEETSALEADRAALQGELQSLTEQHNVSLREAREQALREGQRELEQLREELSSAHQRQTRQLKEEEGTKLREALEQQKEAFRRREEELRDEALRMRQSAIEEEHRKRDAEKEEAVQVHCGMLQEQNREAVERERGEAERERRNALALQNKVVELQTTVQELESEACAQRRERSSALAATRRCLREENQAELQRLCRRMEQEKQEEVSRLEEAVRRAEGEAGRVQRELVEREGSHKQRTARLEQQIRLWAQELGDECQQLYLLLEHSGAPGAAQLPHCPTVAQAVQNLRAVREQLQQLISHLQQQLDSERHSAQQLSREKERELRMQREQLGMEREQALDSLKDKLIQEHVEELSSLNRAQLREGAGEGGGVASSLRRQLHAKDQELREVQRSMAQWKEHTTARLARKFEDELTAELERKAPKGPKGRLEKQRQLEQLEGEMRYVTVQECYDSGAPQSSVSSPCLRPGDHPVSPGPPDLASLKLLRHLQTRVRQLRAENQAHVWYSSPQRRPPLSLAGSYLETIAPSQDSAQFWSHSSVRTTQS